MVRLSFARVAGIVSIVWGALFVSMMVGKTVAATLAVGPVAVVILRGVTPAIIAIVVATMVFARATKTTHVATLSYLSDVGLRLPRPRQWHVALVAMLPLLVAYAIVFGALRVPTETQAPFVARLLKYAVAQGLAEELVFRGMAFQLLRIGRSFRRAALLSAVLFALVHVTNLVNGFSAEVVIGMALSTVYAFVMAIPFSLLFERGGRSIAGGALLHFAIDSNNWFAKLGESTPGLLVYVFVGALGSLLTVVLLARRWLPESIEDVAPRY